MSDSPKMKKSSSRRKAGSTPIPKGPGNSPLCGHDGHCSLNACAVTYAGPVSRMHDHHMVAAAHGTTHIWPAAVISALALLITGSVAFSSVQASEDMRMDALRKQAANRGDIERIVQQLNRIESLVTETRDAVVGTKKLTAREIMDTMNELPTPGTKE